MYRVKEQQAAGSQTQRYCGPGGFLCWCLPKLSLLMRINNLTRCMLVGLSHFDNPVGSEHARCHVECCHLAQFRDLVSAVLAEAASADTGTDT